MDNLYKIAAAAAGAFISFITGIPMIFWVLLGVMTLDMITGMICASMGKSQKTEGGGLSSTVAFEGLKKKFVILVIVALSCLIDICVMVSAGLVSFHATAGAVCLWFVASEGMSILENAAEIGLPIPSVITQALEVMRGAGTTDKEE